MIQQYQKIILVSDGTEISDSAERTALNLAKQHGASVIIVDTIRPRPALAKLLTSKYDDHFDEFVCDKQIRLEQIAERFKQANVLVDVKVLFGKSSEEIARKAKIENADLVVRYNPHDGEMKRRFAANPKYDD